MMLIDAGIDQPMRRAWSSTSEPVPGSLAAAQAGSRVSFACGGIIGGRALRAWPAGIRCADADDDDDGERR